MIEIFRAGDESYKMSYTGEALANAISAQVTMQLNGVWEAVIEVAVDEEGRWQILTEGAVLRIPLFAQYTAGSQSRITEKKQLFRVDSVQVGLDTITATAYPIAYDLGVVKFLTDTRVVDGTAQDVLDAVLEGSEFSGSSDMTDTATAYYMDKSALDAITGDDDNSLLNRWGGEILYDNYKLYHAEEVGQPLAFEIRYGLNIQGITDTISLENTLTHIYPRAYNGRKYTGGDGYVAASGMFSTVRPLPRKGAVTFDDVMLAEDVLTDEALPAGVTICANQAELNAALYERAQKLIADGISNPSVTIEIDGYVDLSDYPDYSAMIHNACLGSRVYVLHPNVKGRGDGLFGVETRITEIVYDAIIGQIIGLTLTPSGRTAANALNKISSVVSHMSDVMTPGGAIKSSALTGQVDLRQAGMYAGYTPASTTDTPAVLVENIDSSSPGYGAVALGAQGISAASQKDAQNAWIFKAGYTGTVTIGGQTLEFIHGILVNVT